MTIHNITTKIYTIENRKTMHKHIEKLLLCRKFRFYFHTVEIRINFLWGRTTQLPHN